MQLELVVAEKVFQYSMCSNCDNFDFKKITVMDIMEERFDGNYEAAERSIKEMVQEELNLPYSQNFHLKLPLVLNLQ